MANRRLSDAIDDFMRYASSAYAPSTLRSFRWTLDVFLTETGNIWVRNLVPRHVDVMLTAVAQAGIGAGTINNHVYRLRVFCDFCKRRKFVPSGWDPVGYRRRLKAVPSSKLRIPASRFGEFLDAADTLRDRAAFALCLYLCLRKSEMLALCIKDVHLEAGDVDVIIQKTRQRDVMPISTELDGELRRWLGVYAECMQSPLGAEWRLVPSKVTGSHNERDEKGRLLPWDGPMRLLPDREPTRLDLRVKAALGRMGYEDMTGVGLHTLRRSGARARFDVLREQGYDGALRQVAALLHHTTTINTEKYLGIDIDVQHRDEEIRGKSMYGGLSPAAALRPALRVLKGGR